MNIRELGTEITDVPGVEYIRIQPDTASEQGVEVRVKFDHPDDLPPISFGIEEFSKLANAVAFANDRVTWLARTNGPNDE